MQGDRANTRGVIGQVINVVGSGGPASGITMDVAMTNQDGSISQERYDGVRPSYLPDDFDIIIKLGAHATVAWISETHGIWMVQWIPMTTTCT